MVKTRLLCTQLGDNTVTLTIQPAPAITTSNGVVAGDALMDACGVCDTNPFNDNQFVGDSGGTATTVPCSVDCAGVIGATATIVACNNCFNQTSPPAAYDPAVYNCIQDDAGNWVDAGANGVVGPGEGVYADDCGISDAIPGNDNTTCVQDCAGVWRCTSCMDMDGSCDDDP